MRPIKVTNHFLTGISWLDAAACDFSTGNHIDVWRITTYQRLPIISELLAILPQDELARANRFFQQKDRDRFIVSRWALRNIIAKYIGMPPADIVFEAGKNKKPHVKSDSVNLHYNLSHSGGHILLAVAGSVLGADIEFINNDFKYSEVLADNFSANEIRYINEAEHTDRFFRLWTRKEAITKATAQGLDCDLRLLPALDGTHEAETGVIASDEDWVINSFAIDGQYAASVAHTPAIDKIAFYNL